MRFCSGCGEKLEDNEFFCPKCQTYNAPSEGSSDSDLASFSQTRRPKQQPVKKKKSTNKIAYIIIVAVLIIAAVIGGCFAISHKKSDDNKADSVTEAVSEINPLTGEAGYNAAAIGKRPVAVVVENEYSTESVRPQWGLSDADIVLEGESEYSTRLLLFWADYTNMPSQIGPARSARPPFIRFSELFDCVFIHAGLSKSRDNYIGADTVFEEDNVDHINLLSYSEDGTYFGRDGSRTSMMEHTGYLNGTSTAALLEKNSIRTSVNSADFTELKFNKQAKALSENAALSVQFKWSFNCPKKGSFYYDEATQKYSTEDFDSEYGSANLKFENLIFLFDETEYIVKENYKSAGNSETYCDYKLSGGEGRLLSQGTYIDITWEVESGKLRIKDSGGKEIKLNPGKSYIGYGSSNNGGEIVIE